MKTVLFELWEDNIQNFCNEFCFSQMMLMKFDYNGAIDIKNFI